MNYIDIYGFLEDQEGSWREVIKGNLDRYKHNLFSEMKEAYFWKINPLSGEREMGYGLMFWQ